MGLCQSREANSHDAHRAKTDVHVPQNAAFPFTPAKNPKLVVIAEEETNHDAMATPATVASPESIATPGSAFKEVTPTFEKHSKKKIKSRRTNLEDDVEEYKTMEFIAPSLMHVEELDKVIVEETDPDAPSDEEEDYEKNVLPLKSTEPGRIVSAKELSQLPIRTKHPRSYSPPRPMSSIKLRSRDPNSVIHHPPVVTPPPGQAKSLLKIRQGSLDSHTMSQFKKLKLQVKLAAHKERASRRRSKVEDRYDDVRGYRELWKRFEEIEQLIEKPSSAGPPRRHSRTRNNWGRKQRNFDLHNPSTWFFDFENMIDDELEGADDGDDDQSQTSCGSLSLLSTASMESQKRYYEQKQRYRQRKQSGRIISKPSLEETLQAMDDMKVEQGDDEDSIATGNDDESVVSTNSNISRGTRLRMQRLMCTPKFIKFKRPSKIYLEENQPSQTKSYNDDSEVRKTSPPPTKKASVDRAKVTPLPDYGPGSAVADVDDLSIATDEPENDYGVRRRRRLRVNRFEESSIASETRDKSNKPNQSSTSIELSSSTHSGGGPRWRSFPQTKVRDDILMTNATKCLENVYAALELKESDSNCNSNSRHSQPERQGSISHEPRPKARVTFKTEEVVNSSCNPASIQFRSKTDQLPRSTPSPTRTRSHLDSCNNKSPNPASTKLSTPKSTSKNMAKAEDRFRYNDMGTAFESPSTTPQKPKPPSKPENSNIYNDDVGIHSMSTEDFARLGRSQPTSSSQDQNAEIANAVMDEVSDLLARFREE